MRLLSALAVLALLAAPAPAAERHASPAEKHPVASDKRVWRIDSLIATRKGGGIVVQAKGAVQTGGWKNPRLHIIHSDHNAVTVEFLATPPPPGMTVIEALVPVAAEAHVRLKTRAPSVRAVADANEMTAQILR